MKTAYLTWTFFLIGLLSSLYAQDQLSNLPQVAVLNVDAEGLVEDPKMLGNLLRLELQKTEQFQVMDKYDMADKLSHTEIDPMGCYATRCLLEAGAALDVDKMITGSAEKFMDKIIITLKIVDISQRRVEKSYVGEYLIIEEELQHMVKLAMNELLDMPVDPILESNLVYYSMMAAPRANRIINNGPRMGMAMLTGVRAERLEAPLDQGGFDAVPFLSQFGYQYELQYISSGNFQALIETIGLVSGLEQSLFIPSLTVLNGFRESKYGFEFGFGPSFSMRKIAQGYYTGEGDSRRWNLAYEWNHDDGPNPNPIVERLDSRGNPELYTTWVWSVGKTFRSGYLNIPVNLFGSYYKKDWQYGISVGFNLQRHPQRKNISKAKGDS